MESIEVPADRVLEIVKQACLTRTHCRVTVAAEAESAFASSFLHTDRSKSSKSTKKMRTGARGLLILAPDGGQGPEEGEKIELRFEYDNLSMVCYSTFQQAVIYTDEHGTSANAWALTFPDSLFQLQRRAFFRVRASATDPVNIGMTLPGKPENIVDTRGKRVSTRRSGVIRQSKPKTGEVSGILWDISGGGLSFTLTPQPPFVISVNAEMQLGFTLPGIKEGLELNGRVVARKESEEGQTIYCIEFIDVDANARVRRSHNLILQYIAKRERELLKSLRMKRRWN